MSHSTTHLARRHHTVRETMLARRLDGYLLTHGSDLAYLSGFTGDDSIGLLTVDGLFLLSDFRYKEQAEQECPSAKLLLRDGRMSELLARTLLELRLNRVGYEANFTQVGLVNATAAELERVGQMAPAAVTLVAVEDLMVKIRRIKDESEIAIIRQAVTIAQDAWTATQAQLRVGMTENHLAGLLTYEMRQRGASDSSFPCIIASEARGSLPHYRPADKPVTADTPLLVDWGARYQGYCSDLTRTFSLGKPVAKIREIFEIVLQAQQAAIAAIRPGVKNHDVDAVARGIITKAGYGDLFGHGLGHGLGRDIHELPVLRKSGEPDVLQPGMVVTVEPGIYIPGVGGVRIEDDVLVTPDGHEVLSDLPRDWDSCRIG